MVSLDEGSFPALELNNRRLSVKNSFCRKNGIYTRYGPPSPPPPPQPPPRAGGSFLSHRAGPSIMHSPWDGSGAGGGLAPHGGDPVLPNVPPAMSCSLCTSPDVAGC